jgi:hypothetical protein
MNTPRETIFEALLAQVATAAFANGAPALQTASRKFVDWTQCPPGDQPAAFLVHGFEHASQGRATGQTSWRVKAVLFVYCQHSSDSQAIPGQQLNEVLDAIENALKPPPWDDRQTLGGIVAHAFIDGEIPISEGSLPDDTTSVAVIGITMETGA